MTTLEKLLFWKAAGGGSKLYQRTIINNPAVFTTEVAKPLKGLSIPFTSESGLTGLNIYRTGVNFCGCEWESGTVNSLTGADYDDGTQKFRTKGYFAIAGGLTYIVVDESRYKRVYWYDKDKNYISSHTTSSPGKTAPADACFARAVVESDRTPNPEQTYSLNYPESETEYVPYSGTTIPVSWQTEAGTVYGGTLDALTGALTVTSPESKTVQLDPVTLSTLIGENVIWTDTNSDNTIVYLSKTQGGGLGGGFGGGFGGGSDEPDEPGDPEEPTEPEEPVTDE